MLVKLTPGCPAWNWVLEQSINILILIPAAVVVVDALLSKLFRQLLLLLFLFQVSYSGCCCCCSSRYAANMAWLFSTAALTSCGELQAEDDEALVELCDEGPGYCKKNYVVKKLACFDVVGVYIACLKCSKFFWQILTLWLLKLVFLAIYNYFYYNEWSSLLKLVKQTVDKANLFWKHTIMLKIDLTKLACFVTIRSC